MTHVPRVVFVPGSIVGHNARSVASEYCSTIESCRYFSRVDDRQTRAGSQHSMELVVPCAVDSVQLVSLSATVQHVADLLGVRSDAVWTSVGSGMCDRACKLA